MNTSRPSAASTPDPRNTVLNPPTRVPNITVVNTEATSNKIQANNESRKGNNGVFGNFGTTIEQVPATRDAKVQARATIYSGPT